VMVLDVGSPRWQMYARPFAEHVPNVQTQP
jgi:hypothetical protein